MVQLVLVLKSDGTSGPVGLIDTKAAGSTHFTHLAHPFLNVHPRLRSPSDDPTHVATGSLWSLCRRRCCCCLGGCGHSATLKFRDCKTERLSISEYDIDIMQPKKWSQKNLALEGWQASGHRNHPLPPQTKNTPAEHLFRSRCWGHLIRCSSSSHGHSHSSSQHLSRKWEYWRAAAAVHCDSFPGRHRWYSPPNETSRVDNKSTRKKDDFFHNPLPNTPKNDKSSTRIFWPKLPHRDKLW